MPRETLHRARVPRTAGIVAALCLVLALAACGTDPSGAERAGPESPGPTPSSPDAPFVDPSEPTVTSTPTEPPASAAPAHVTVHTRTYVDPSRPSPGVEGVESAPTRSLYTRVWTPDTPGDRPLVLLAHGLGGEPEKFHRLATAWAEAGYVVAAPRFPGSSDTGGQLVADMVQQPADISFVLDQLLAEPDWAIDAERIGVSGLSLGGSTVYALTTDPCCVDPRIRVAAVFDGLRPGPFGPDDPVANTIPMLVIHCDQDPVLPYQAHAVRGFADLVAPAWLVTLPCAQHSEPYEDTPSDFDQLVVDLTLALWDHALDGPADEADPVTPVVQADGRATVQSHT